MKPSIQNSGKLPASISTREVKKRINIQWNSALFFQLGLIVSLLFMIWIMQQDWKLSSDTTMGYRLTPSVDDPPVRTYSVLPEMPKTSTSLNKPLVKEIIPQKPVSSLTVINSVSTLTETRMPSASKSPTSALPPAVVPITKMPTRNAMQVEEAPIFPGCENIMDKLERRNCFQQKVQNYVARQFEVDRFIDKYSGESKRIHVQFTIDQNGNVNDIKAMCREGDDLAREASRVVGNMPKMIPAKQNGRPVNVFYQLPIALHIDY